MFQRNYIPGQRDSHAVQMHEVGSSLTHGGEGKCGWNAVKGGAV